MNFNNIKITIFKELRGIIRDKKSFQKLIFYTLLIPIIILLFGFLFDFMNESKYIVGTNYELSSEERDIVDDFNNITFKNYSNIDELTNAYDINEIDGYIVKDDNKYTIYTNESQNSGEIILSLSSLYLESYSKVLGNNYLVKKGIDSNKVFNNILIDSVSLSKDSSNILTKTMFSLVITYITMIVVLVSVVVVTDTTSGEKERGTLETILTFPVKCSELVIGKYLSSSILGFVVGLIAYLFALPTFHIGRQLFKSYKDLVFDTNILSVLLVVFVILLTALLSSGVCMVLSGRAKSYKEAQSSLQFVSIFPMIPYFLSITEVNSFIFNLIPITNCSSLLNDIIMNNINFSSLFVVIVSTIIYIVCILIYISRQYNKEETLFL